MHIQILKYHLKDLSEDEYRVLCDQSAAAYAQVDGLISKIWLADPETNTYGGIYIWRDRSAMQEFSKTALFQTVAAHPNLSGITSEDFAVLEAPTRVTRGLPGAAAGSGCSPDSLAATEASTHCRPIGLPGSAGAGPGW